MALVSALKCPILASGQERALKTAVKRVLKEYKGFCTEYYHVPLDSEIWQAEGTFGLSCFTSRVNIGYFIISVYQGIHRQANVAATSDFASAIKQETWTSIAESLLVGGLKVSVEKFKEGTLTKVGKELRKVLLSNKGHLQAFLLSLLQMEGESGDKDEVQRKGQKRSATSGTEDEMAGSQGCRKKARSKERRKKDVPNSLDDHGAAKASEVEEHADQQERATGGVLESGAPAETDEEEIKAERDPRKSRSSPPATNASERQNVTPGFISQATPDFTAGGLLTCLLVTLLVL